MNRGIKIIKTAALLLILILSGVLLNSCATSNNRIQKVFPRDSFLKIEKKLIVYSCAEDGTCNRSVFGSSASGAVVRNVPNGSYVLTAEHVCDKSYIVEFAQRLGASKYGLDFKVIDIEGVKYDIDIVAMDAKNDICVLWVEDLERPAIPLAPKAPAPGERLYNVAAPLGVFAINMIPLQEGFYDGIMDGRAIYSIPAVGGSSGSPVVNRKGELVGMIHSVFTRFSHVSIGPTYHELKKFLDTHIDRHAAHNILDNYIRILNNLKSEVH